MLDLALKVKKGRERHIKETHHILDTIRLLEPVQYVPTRLRRPLQGKIMTQELFCRVHNTKAYYIFFLER